MNKESSLSFSTVDEVTQNGYDEVSEEGEWDSLRKNPVNPTIKPMDGDNQTSKRCDLITEGSSPSGNLTKWESPSQRDKEEISILETDTAETELTHLKNGLDPEQLIDTTESSKQDCSIGNHHKPLDVDCLVAEDRDNGADASSEISSSDRNDLDANINSHSPQIERTLQLSDFESESLSNQSPVPEETSSQDAEYNRKEFKLAFGEDIIFLDERSATKDELLEIITKLTSQMKTNEESYRVKYESQLAKSESSAALLQKEIELFSQKLAEAKDSLTEKGEELEMTREKLTQENIAVRTELTHRLEQLMMQCQSSNKDKESMVMKYAISENEVLKLKKQRDGLDKKSKDLQKDKELLQNKLKSLSVDKSKISNALQSKIQDYSLASREIEKLKEELNAKDVKIKWGQNKLRTEMDAHKETQSRLDKALDKITKHNEELLAMKKEAEKIVQDSIENEDSRANTLDKQLREQKATVITERQKKEDLAAYLKTTTSELETLKNVYFTLENDSSGLREKVLKYEQEREESERLFASLQAEVINARQGAADLSSKLSTSSATAELLEKEQLKSQALEERLKDLESSLEEKSAELSQCRTKEAELLSFTQKLTDQSVKLQSQFTALEGKIRLLEVEKEETREEMIEAQQEATSLKKQLDSVSISKNEETEDLASKLRTKMEEVESLKTKVSDLYNEIKVQQKKHQNANKDVNREILKLRKRLESFENERSYLQSEECPEDRGGDERLNCYSAEFSAHSSHSESPSSSSTIPPHDSLSQASRAFSSSSLNAIDGHTSNGRLHKGIFSSEEGLSADILVERIIRLQKDVMRKSEKIDFLEEHVSQLVAELKKKNRIIHHYIMKEESGVMSNSKSDSAKAEIIKRGGIMASVYGSAPKDGAMTLELSLEINKKLQAVLEDTLLKNITLKENLNTLGDEVANLSLQNSRLHLSKKP